MPETRLRSHKAPHIQLSKESMFWMKDLSSSRLILFVYSMFIVNATTVLLVFYPTTLLRRLVRSHLVDPELPSCRPRPPVGDFTIPNLLLVSFSVPLQTPSWKVLPKRTSYHLRSTLISPLSFTHCPKSTSVSHPFAGGPSFKLKCTNFQRLRRVSY